MKYANFVVFRSNAILNIDSVDFLCHSSEIGGLFSMKSFSKTHFKSPAPYIKNWNEISEKVVFEKWNITTHGLANQNKFHKLMTRLRLVIRLWNLFWFASPFVVIFHFSKTTFSEIVHSSLNKRGKTCLKLALYTNFSYYRNVELFGRQCHSISFHYRLH